MVVMLDSSKILADVGTEKGCGWCDCGSCEQD